MTIEEAEEKLSNMHFDSIVKSYCNKVNDIKRLKAEIKQLNEQLRIHNVVGQSEQLVCDCCEDKLVEEKGDWCNDCLENPSRVITN